MDKLCVRRSKSSSKQAKSKRNPIKVVYISNPMKVETSASEFRALVQELTGQDSNLDDASRYIDIDDCVDDKGVNPVPDQETYGLHHQEVPMVDPYGETIRSLDSTFEHFESFDRVFNPYMTEYFNGYNSSSGLTYDVSPRSENP